MELLKHGISLLRLLRGFGPAPARGTVQRGMGLRDMLSRMGSVGNWIEYPEDMVKDTIYEQADQPDLIHAKEASTVTQPPEIRPLGC